MTYHEKFPPRIARSRPFDAGHNVGQSGHCLLYGSDTAGAHSLSVAILRRGSEAPLHVHSREDETFFVIEGQIDARVGDEHHTLGAGDSIFLPRGLKHRLLCLSDEAKLIMLLHPPGLENFFDDLDQKTAQGPVDPEEMKAIAMKFGVAILSD
ncbi:MAG: cupin domain-containing protein [Planctomycetota bacterium]